MLLASAPLPRVIASQIGDIEALINGLDDQGKRTVDEPVPGAP
jgi:hypothetical protein